MAAPAARRKNRRIIRTKPKTENILGYQFSIEYVPQKHLDGTDEDVHGETYGFKKQIRIRDTLTGDDLGATLIHEYMHAILHVSGWTYALDDKVEEGLVTVLENGLWPIIKDWLENGGVS